LVKEEIVDPTGESLEAAEDPQRVAGAVTVRDRMAVLAADDDVEG
jgi:hypothetical protein